MRVKSSILVASAVLALSCSSALFARDYFQEDSLVEKIRAARSCPIQKDEKEEASGWFSGFGTKVGNALRWAGDKLRQDVDSTTPVGYLVNSGQAAAAKRVSAALLIPVPSDVLFGSFGNGLRWMGQALKGTAETQTPVRVIMNNLHLSRASSEREVESALHTAAAAILKAEPTAAPELFLQVAQGLTKRGVSTKDLDLLKIYINAASTHIMQKNLNISEKDFCMELGKLTLYVRQQTSVSPEFERDLKRAYVAHRAAAQLDAARRK